MGYVATGSGSFTIRFTPEADQYQMRDMLLNRYDELCAAEVEERDNDSRHWIEVAYQDRKHKLKLYDDPFWWLTVVLQEVGFNEIDRDTDSDGLLVELSYFGKYDELAILNLLNKLAPYTQEGCISYRGEDGEHWRHLYLDGQWVEQGGRICYEESKPEPYPPFEHSSGNMRRLIAEVRRQAIHDDRPHDGKAEDLLTAFDCKDPDGVLQALTGRILYEHGLAAGIWKADDADGHTETDV